MSDRGAGQGVARALRLWLGVTSRLVPGGVRASWLREWEAELAAARRADRPVLRMAGGALPDAWAVRRCSRASGNGRAEGSPDRRLWLTGTGVELRRAVRSLGRAPGFTAASVITLGVGLGATAAIFTLVDAILLRPLPYAESDRLVRVEHTMGDGGSTNALARFAFALFAEENRSFELLGGYWSPGLLTLAGDGTAERVVGVEATAGLLAVLGATPLVGRLFTENDALPEGGAGVVLSESLWRRRYGGDPSVVGGTVLVEGESRLVLGVVSAGADLPDRQVDLWMPYAVPPGVRADDAFRIHTIGLLRDGVSREAAQADADRLTQRFPEFGAFYSTYLDDLGLRTRVRPLRDEVVGELERALWVLLGAVSIVLLVATANVAMLFLVRAESRRSEVAVRAALGAGRARLATSFLSESTLVAFTAGALGLLLAFFAVRLLATLAPPGIPRIDEIQVRGTTTLLVTALSLAAAVGLAGYPAVRFGRSGPGGARGAASGRDRGTTAVGSALVVVQVALALVLLSGASLLLRTFQNLRAVDPGFEPAGVLTAELSLPDISYPEREQVQAFQNQLLERIEALPGVRGAALGPSPLRQGGCTGLHVEGMALREGEFPPCVPVVLVGPGYWEVLGMTLRSGRLFEPADLSQPPVAVVTENAARRLWPGGNPLDGAVHPAPRTGPPWYPVVGIAGAVRGQGPDQPPTEAVYIPAAATGDDGYFERAMGVLIATQPGRELTLVPELRRIARELDPNVPLTIEGTLEDELARSMVRSSFTLFLLATAAGTALILGLVGLYGVIAYRVETRKPEIGLRMAMGARAQQVRTMVLRNSMRLVAAGTVAGLAATVILTRSLSSLLFGVRPGDPWTLGFAATALAVAAALASWIPAQRATRIDPATALRND